MITRVKERETKQKSAIRETRTPRIWSEEDAKEGLQRLGEHWDQVVWENLGKETGGDLVRNLILVTGRTCRGLVTDGNLFALRTLLVGLSMQIYTPLTTSCS